MPSNPPSKFVSWLRLGRVSALPSAVANIMMGYLLASGSWSPALPLVLLCLCSATIYTAGMILNDVFDVEVDLRERPSRPIPARQIKLKSAWNAGIFLLASGFVLSLVAGFVSCPSVSVFSFKPCLIASLLILFVFLYDSGLKKTHFGPWAMGACRGLNVLLGASSFADPDGFLTFSFPVWMIAGSVTILIAGITLFARNETRQNSTAELLPGAALILAGLLGIALIPKVFPEIFSSKLQQLYPLMVLLVAIPLFRRVVVAVSKGTPNAIQLAVIAALKSLIIFDACVCVLACPDKIFFYPLVVAALSIISLILGRWIRAT